MASNEEVEERAFAPLELPSADVIRAFVLATEPAQRKGRLQDFDIRNDVEAASWAVGAVHREFDDLLSTFVSAEKAFHVVFENSLTTKERSIGFRLTTRGLEGHTQYSIVFRRIAPDEIACLDCS